ncbi:MAG: glycosyltransferase family 1 protein, partial [Cyanobacteria bacterium J06558_2]
ENLISELLNYEQKFDFRLYTADKDFKTQYPAIVNPISPSITPDRGSLGHLKRLLWYQTSLNYHLKRQQTALFFSPAAEGMLFPWVPQIIMVHDLIPLKYPEVSPKWQYYYRYILPLILKSSRRIICISQHTKQDLIATYQLDPELIDVIYLGFNRQLFYPQPDPQILAKYNLKKYFLYVGDMRFYKNLSRSLQAFDRLPIKDCQFVITGKKDDFFYPEIGRQVTQLAAKERIIFLDYVPSEDLPGLYSQAQALVFPSLYEGFGLPVLEAMACGCPVITASATSIPEVGGDSALYVNPYDVDEIAQGMSDLLTKAELRKSLINLGLERSQLFDWKQTARRLNSIFDECLQELGKDTREKT